MGADSGPSSGPQPQPPYNSLILIACEIRETLILIPIYFPPPRTPLSPALVGPVLLQDSCQFFSCKTRAICGFGPGTALAGGRPQGQEKGWHGSCMWTRRRAQRKGWHGSCMWTRRRTRAGTRAQRPELGAKAGERGGERVGTALACRRSSNYPMVRFLPHSSTGLEEEATGGCAAGTHCVFLDTPRETASLGASGPGVSSLTQCGVFLDATRKRGTPRVVVRACPTHNGWKPRAGTTFARKKVRAGRTPKPET